MTGVQEEMSMEGKGVVTDASGGEGEYAEERGWEEGGYHAFL